MIPIYFEYLLLLTIVSSSMMHRNALERVYSRTRIRKKGAFDVNVMPLKAPLFLSNKINGKKDKLEKKPALAREERVATDFS